MKDAFEGHFECVLGWCVVGGKHDFVLGAGGRTGRGARAHSHAHTHNIPRQFVLKRTQFDLTPPPPTSFQVLDCSAFLTKGKRSIIATTATVSMVPVTRHRIVLIARFP